MSAPAPPRRESEMDRRIAERRAEVARSRRRSRRRKVTSLGMLLGLLAVGFVIANSPLFAISELEVTGVEGERAAAVLEAAQIKEGDNLLWADTTAATAAVTALPWVDSVEIERLPPAVVAIHVTARKPFAVVRLADTSWTLDATGVVLHGGATEGLLEIDAPSSALPRAGQAASDAAVTGALRFHRDLPEGLAGSVRRYDASSATGIRMEVEIAGQADRAVWIRIGRPEEAGLKGQVAMALLEQAGDLLGPDGPGIAEIDVRAPANPVLVPVEAP